MRSTYVTGQWHLWIYRCQWRLAGEHGDLAHSESDDLTMTRALHVLNGQSLSGVEVGPDNGATTFSFDLGCVLTTEPVLNDQHSDEPVEQWKLRQPNDEWLSVRSDGSYAVIDGTSAIQDAQWQPLPGKQR